MVEVVMNTNNEGKEVSREQAPRRRFGPMKPGFSLPKPDKEEFKAAVNKVSDEISSLNKRIQVLKVEIESRRQSKAYLSPELVDARNVLGDMNGEFNAHQEEKWALKGELDNMDKELNQRRAEARAFREKHSIKPSTSAEKISEEIKKLEYRQQHYSLTAKEEREVLQKIKDLNTFGELLEQINEGERMRKVASSKVGDKNKLLTELRAKINDQKATVGVIREKEMSKSVSVPVLAAERDAAYEKIKALNAELKGLRDDFKAKNMDWYLKKQAFDKEYEGRKRAQHKRWEEERLQRQERQKARELRQQENFVEKYTDEIILCDQLVSCLQKLLPSGEADEGNKAPTVKSQIPVPAGFGRLLPSKKDREAEEMDRWFAGTKKGGQKGKAASKAREKITLAVEIVNSLNRINVKQPHTIVEVAEVIEQVKQKRNSYVQLQAESKAAREKALEKKMAAANVEDAKVEEFEETDGESEEQDLQAQNTTGSEENSVEDGTEPDSVEYDEKSIESVELDTTESDGVTDSGAEEKNDEATVKVVEEPQEGKNVVVEGDSDNATTGEHSL